MMSLIVMFGMAFVFFILFVYCGISIISNLVFGFLEWRIKRRYVNEVLKELAVLPLQWKEEKLQKWYVLLAIIVCGLIWMPSFVAVMDIDNDVNMDLDNVIVKDIIKIEEPLSISEKYGIPERYYLDVEKGTKNISKLREVLKGIKYPHSYEEGVWDCSESSAYAEKILENNGFDAIICGNYSQSHAWVVCRGVWDNNKTYRVAIECVNSPHITTHESYRHPEIEHEDIYAAMGGRHPYEWDWFNVNSMVVGNMT